MKLIQLTILFCCALVFCSWDMLQSDSKGDNGEEIYMTYCKSCHGKKGSLGIGGAAKLTKSELSLDERIEIISNGKGKMTGFGALLSKKEVKAVAKFTETFTK